MKTGFILYTEYQEKLELLNNEELGILMRLIFKYEKTQENPIKTQENLEIPPLVEMAFYFIKDELDRQRVRYEASISNGKQGGRPKKVKSSDNEKEEEKNLEKPSNNLEKPNPNLTKTITKTITKTKTIDNNYNNNKDNNYDNNPEVDDSINVFEIYENEFGRPLTQIEMTKILEMKEKFSDELIAHALGIAVEKNARNFSYVKAILESFEQKGIKTVLEAIADQESFKKQKSKSLSKYPAKKSMQEPNYTKPAEDSNDEDVASILAELEKMGVG